MYMRIGWHLKSVMMYSPASLGGWHWHWVVSEMETKHNRAPGSAGILSLVSSSSAMGYGGLLMSPQRIHLMAQQLEVTIPGVNKLGIGCEKAFSTSGHIYNHP